jgi:hypothetical protein
MIIGKFYDGQSAKARRVQVTILADFLFLRDLDTKDDFQLKINKLETTFSSQQAQLTQDDYLLVLSKDQFNQLNIPRPIVSRETGNFLRLSLIILSCLVGIYAARKTILSHAVDILPDSYLNAQVAELRTSLSLKHCLSSEQDDALWTLFRRLQEDRGKYELYVIPSKTSNAFAMPGNTIVLHDQLLREVSSPEALAAILAHEMAHLQQDHIKTAFIKDMLMDSLLSFSSRSIHGGEILKHYVKELFSQEEEREADILAARMLRENKIDPQGMVDFFNHQQKKLPDLLHYISLSHPSYPDRIKTFTAETYASEPIQQSEAWKQLKKGCSIMSRDH